MSISIQPDPCGRSRSPFQTLRSTGRAEEFPPITTPQITIGLINNMPDAALEATERQFRNLLESASKGFSLQLRLYSIPEIARSGAAAERVAAYYTDIEELWNASLDGLIVTGREPLSADLRQEPYWHSFTRIVDWARECTSSTIWSCLAAHAAVLYMNGVPRIRSARKHCGILNCAQVGRHSLTSGAPARFRVPHSRWNGLDEQQLEDCGYSALTRTERAGFDTFVKQDKSLFVFFQGHPEYEPQTLMLEYRRDVGCYLRGGSANYPSLPESYFDTETELALAEIAREAKLFPRQELLKDVTSLLAEVHVDNSWNSTAACLYGNWLQYIFAQKTERRKLNVSSFSEHGVQRFPHNSDNSLNLRLRDD